MTLVRRRRLETEPATRRPNANRETASTAELAPPVSAFAASLVAAAARPPAKTAPTSKPRTPMRAHAHSRRVLAMTTFAH